MNSHAPRELIRLEGVEKRYGRDRALLVDELRFVEGERVILSGPNGSGKSTLLRLLGGISRPDCGQVWRAPTLRSGSLGYVPQAEGLYREISVADNLSLRGRLNGAVAHPIASAWYVTELGLTPFLGKAFAQLSGGYQRLAATAAALHTDPTWLLLDEPFSGVHALKRETLLARLVHLADRVRLLVIASQAPRDFPQATRSIELLEGRVVARRAESLS